MEVDSYQSDNEEDWYDNTWKKIILGRESLQPLIQLANLGWVETATEYEF